MFVLAAISSNAQTMRLDAIIDSITVSHPVVRMYNNEIRSMDEAAKGAKSWMPPEFSSGNSRKLGHISRQGNVYVRTLLIHGSRAALLAAQRCQARTPEKLTQLQRWAVETAARIGHNKAAVALANKLVRICWAVWCHERRFNGNWQSTKPA